MPPENLVDYTASPEEPSLDAMRYMLMQRNAASATPAVDLPSQIPGVQPAPQQQQQQRPLDRVTEQFKRIGANANPLLMAKSLQDMVTTTVVNPLLMPASIAGEALTGRPITGSLLARQPQTPLGQDFAESLFKGLETAKVPHMWPLTPRPAGMRPALTPNDVRVMGARATHAVREAGQIPTDIANVRNAGIQRMSPLTGQPSVGSRMGTAIEGTSQAAGRVGDVARDVGQSTADYMQMRRDMGLSPVPGVPPEFFPDLRMYAMRPKDSTLVTPSVPPTKDVTALDIGTAPHAAIYDIGAHKPELRTPDALAYLAGMDLDVPRNDAQGTAPITSERRAAFNAFIEAQAKALYPDAPNAREAVLAFDEQFSRQTDKDAARIKLYDEFRESPEGQAVDMGDLPSSTELQERHAAASQWLNSTLLNYARRKFGAEGDPLVQQASQGFTMLPADDVRRMSESVNEDVLRRRRAQAGMPVAGTLAPAIRDKSVELADATAAVAQLQQRREEYRNIAMQQGLGDPRHLPEYAATTNPLSAAVDKRDKLQDELSNLQLGRDYEKLSDIAVAVDTQPNLLGKIEYPQQQFYPSVTRARPDETLFHVSRNNALQSTGFNELAAQFYDDVIRGNIPIDKLKGLTVEKYVRGKSESRVAEEKRQAQASAELKTNIESRMQEDMAQYVKPENYFGNVGVLELSTSTGLHIDEIRRLISDDTLVLDHCVAEGPTPGSKAKNLWNGRERRYMPLVDPATGQLLPNSPRQYTRYMREAGDPDANQAGMLASVRDKATGLPVATIEFKRLANGKYEIGYASGYQNGDVKKEYRAAIKEYLNSRADVIHKLEHGESLRYVGLIDLHSPDALNDAMRILNVPRREAAAALNQAVDSGQLPRFGSSADLRQALTSSQPAEPQPAAQQPAAQQFVTATDLYNYLRDVAQAVGHDEGRAMLHVLRGVRESFGGAPYEDLLREHPTAFAERIAEFAQEQGNAIVEQELLALADRIAPPVPSRVQLNPLGAWPLAQEMPAAQQPAVQGQAADAVLIPSTRLAIDDAFELAERGLQGDDEATRRFAAFESDVRNAYLRPNATVSELRMLRTRIENAFEFYTNANPIPELSNALYNDLLPAINAILEPPVAQQPAQAAPQQPALGLFEEFAIARDLLENARLDNQTFDTGDLGTTLFVLENGNFDDPRFRALGPQSAAAQREVAAALRQMMQEAGILTPGAQQIAYPGPPVDNQPTPQQQAIINDIRAADLADIVNFIDPNRWPLITARTDQAVSRVRTDWPADWQDVLLAEAAQMAEAIRNGQMPDITDGLDVIERELVAREVQQRIDDLAGRQRPIAAQPAAQQFDNTPFDDALMNFAAGLTDIAMDIDWPGAIAEIDRVLDDLAHGADSIYGLWEGDEPLTDREREYLAEQLRALRQEYELEMHAAAAERGEDLGDWEPDDDHPANRPQGYKAGGAVRKSAHATSFALKYANGGTVPQTQSLDAMKYELMMRSK